ncbi:MAG: flagellar FlbD family protein, partial [Leptospiraceae bacterium]|nr:flagellar FlbD family protein [Leptospiraceae bacterium]
VRLGNETKLLLKESIDEVIAAIIEFKRKIYLEQRER